MTRRAPTYPRQPGDGEGWVFPVLVPPMKMALRLASRKVPVASSRTKLLPLLAELASDYL
jgi:hypothetical protein